MLLERLTVIAEILQARNRLNLILLPAFPLAVIVSYWRRKRAIGGWLLFSCYWMSAVLLIYLSDGIANLGTFLHPATRNPTRQLALISAIYPRLLAMLSVVVLVAGMLKSREWIWVERLKLMLGATVLVAGVSLVLDAIYFPGSLVGNSIRWIMLPVWLAYFHVSKRVSRVFRTKDWFASPADGKVDQPTEPG